MSKPNYSCPGWNSNQTYCSSSPTRSGGGRRRSAGCAGRRKDAFGLSLRSAKGWNGELSTLHRWYFSDCMEGIAMTDSEILKTMAHYNQWANRDLFAAVRALPDGEAAKQRRSLFKNIINTLNHPLVADRMWWAHLHKEPHSHKALNEVLHDDFEKLQAAREEMDQRLLDYVDCLSEHDADEQLNFTLLSGAKGRMNRRMILMHM